MCEHLSSNEASGSHHLLTVCPGWGKGPFLIKIASQDLSSVKIDCSRVESLVWAQKTLQQLLNLILH